MRVIISVLAITLLLACPVRAEFYSGHDLVKYMKEFEKAETPSLHPENWEHVGFFVGFVVGVWDSHESEFSKAEVSRGQVCTVVMNYLKNHPEEWHLTGKTLVLKALRIAFPKKR